MVTDGSEVVASVLGSFAAALECEVDGNIPISREAMMHKVDAIEKRARFG
jgi:hypothetical protein